MIGDVTTIAVPNKGRDSLRIMAERLPVEL